MGQLMSKTCKNCGKTFLTRDPEKIYCNVKCEDFAESGIKVDFKKEKIETIYDNNLEQKICLYCGMEFYPRKGEHRDNYLERKFCCKSCAAAFHHREKRRK